jgi:hypothetical protein
MAGIYARSGGRVEPSEKQAICLLRIQDKLGGLAAMYGRQAAEDGDHRAESAAVVTSVDA